MSLLVQKKDAMEKLGAARKAAREYGLATTEAELKGDLAKARELQASFDKAMPEGAHRHAVAGGVPGFRRRQL